ncbi:MAG TPA: hypothetical protein VKA95_02070 [Nitrososphaeraceae archaeon]|nr:hypothetical protein [Nitrososphaeraceae archaeon]
MALTTLLQSFYYKSKNAYSEGNPNHRPRGVACFRASFDADKLEIFEMPRYLLSEDLITNVWSI